MKIPKRFLDSYGELFLSASIKFVWYRYENRLRVGEWTANWTFITWAVNECASLLWERDCEGIPHCSLKCLYCRFYMKMLKLNSAAV